MTYNTDTGFAGFSLGQRFEAFRVDMADRAAKRKVYRTTLAELEVLSTRDLADLALHGLQSGQSPTRRPTATKNSNSDLLPPPFRQV